MPYITSAEKIGRKKGKQEGRQEGKKEGKKEELLSVVRRAHEQGVTVPTIAKIVDLDVSMVNKILNNEDIDIPLHLLDSSDTL